MWLNTGDITVRVMVFHHADTMLRSAWFKSGQHGAVSYFTENLGRAAPERFAGIKWTRVPEKGKTHA